MHYRSPFQIRIDSFHQSLNGKQARHPKQSIVIKDLDSNIYSHKYIRIHYTMQQNQIVSSTKLSNIIKK